MKALTLLITLALFFASSTSLFASDTRWERLTVAAEQVYKSKGAVNSVDIKAGKLSLNMDAVPSLNWPPMTMDFNVSDKKTLEKLKPGQKIEFDFIEKNKGQYMVTKITPAK